MVENVARWDVDGGANDDGRVAARATMMNRAGKYYFRCRWESQ